MTKIFCEGDIYVAG